MNNEKRSVSAALVCGANLVCLFGVVVMKKSRAKLWRRPTGGTHLLIGSHHFCTGANKYKTAERTLQWPGIIACAWVSVAQVGCE